MSLVFNDISKVKDPYSDVARINSAFKGWESDAAYINKKFIKNHNHIVFDFVKTKLSEQYVGYAIAANDPKHFDAAYLSFIAVDKVVQNQGIGYQLLDSTVEKVKALAFKKLNLHCEENNLGFYTKFAQRHILPFSYAEQPNPFGDQEKYYLLTLELTKEQSDGKHKSDTLKGRVSVLEESNKEISSLPLLMETCSISSKAITASSTSSMTSSSTSQL